MAKYLTKAGLDLFWSGLKTKLRSKVDVVEGKALSTNDLTNILKGNYDAAFANRVTGVRVNGAVNASKAKFTTSVYEVVADPTGNPSENGYYEENDGTYTASSDTEVDAEKTYYTLNDAVRVLDITMPTKLQDLANDSVGKFATESYVDGITGTPTAGKTLVEMIGDVASGNLSVLFVSTLPSVQDATNNTIYMVPMTVYKAVSEPTGNPSTSDYYEYNPSTGVYTASEDTAVDATKRYYVVDTQANNVYAEYMVATKEGVGKVLERIGDTRIDLSQYVLASDLVPVSDAEITTMMADDTSEGATDA